MSSTIRVLVANVLFFLFVIIVCGGLTAGAMAALRFGYGTEILFFILWMLYDEFF